jgi:hypothetical protein
MSLDHGLLNIPFAKRGLNIDAEIDRYKKSEARRLAAASRVRHDTRKAASAALKAAPDAKLAGLAAKLGKTIVQTRAQLKSECISSPHLVLSFLTEGRNAKAAVAS